MPVRLVATDLDGTLLDPWGRVSARAARAVGAARAAGIHVVAVTGRPPQATWDLATAAGLGPLGICSNGAATVDLGRQVVIAAATLAEDIARRLVSLLRQAAPGIRLAVDVADHFWYEYDFFDPPTGWDEPYTAVGDITEAIGPDCFKLIARLPGHSAMELISRLEGSVGEEGHVTTSGLDWVDIGAPGVTKAFALERVCRLLGIGVTDVIAVGDNHNDLTMLAWAGTAMAPANAVTEVLALADRVLPTNAEDGVAVLLEELASAP